LMTANPTEALRTAINNWKAKFEKTRWDQWDRLPETEKRHALEHAMGGYITGITYPFVKRPAECPLSLFEIGIALWVSEGDFYEAALRLRVSPERLATAIKNVPELKKYMPDSKQRKRDAGEPLIEVIPRDMGLNLTIRVAKLCNSPYALGYRMEGDCLVIDLDRQMTREQNLRYRRLMERAEEVAKEAKP
jgi:hypothetical protein